MKRKSEPLLAARIVIDTRTSVIRRVQCRRIGCRQYLRIVKVSTDMNKPVHEIRCGACDSIVAVLKTIKI